MSSRGHGARAGLVGLVAIALIACGSTTRGAVECPAGATWNGAVCIGDVACPPGTTLNGSVCSPPVVASGPAEASVADAAPPAQPSEAPIAPSAPAPAAPATATASAPANRCGCAPNDLNCSMKCAAAHSPGGSGPGSPMMPPASPSPAPTAPFDRAAAAAALSGAMASAKGCLTGTGPRGSGKVTVVYAPSGVVKSVAIGAPYAGTPVGACVVAAFRATRVPEFVGADVTVGKAIDL